MTNNTNPLCQFCATELLSVIQMDLDKEIYTQTGWYCAKCHKYIKK
jgi:hypothetical protein